MGYLTQGSIINGLRSNVYHNCKTLGVVISARCDIANEKIADVHILSAIDIQDWVYEEAFYNCVEQDLSSIYQTLSSWAQKNSLNFSVLKDLGPEKTKKNIEMEQNEKTRVSLFNACDNWKVCEDMLSLRSVSKESRKQLLEEKYSKFLTAQMTELFTGKQTRYCFIPALALSDNAKQQNSIVVDLKNIKVLPFEIINQISQTGLDFQAVPNMLSINEINKHFYFETNDDFMIIWNTIKSPWIEFLMQKFALAFIRIGVDGPQRADVTEYVDAVLKNESGLKL